MASKKKHGWTASNRKHADRKFKSGDIVSIDYSKPSAECDANGKILLDVDKKIMDTIGCKKAVCAVIGNVDIPPEQLTRRVDENGLEADSYQISYCYIVIVIPGRDVQPQGFMIDRLGRYFICEEQSMVHGKKEKKIEDMGLWDHVLLTFDEDRIDEMRNSVHKEKLAEGSIGGMKDDR